MNHRHTVKFNVGDKELQIGTDDLEGLAAIPWFADFLEVKQTGQTGRIVHKPNIDISEISARVEALQSKVDDVTEENKDLKAQLQEAEDDMDDMRKRHEDEIKELTESMSKEFENTTPPSGTAPQGSAPGVRPQPGQQMTRQRLPPSTFLEIQPNEMNEGIWASLTNEQQQEWLRKWNIQS